MAAGGLTLGEGSLPTSAASAGCTDLCAGVFVDPGAAASDIATANDRRLTRTDDERISIKLVLLSKVRRLADFGSDRDGLSMIAWQTSECFRVSASWDWNSPLFGFRDEPWASTSRIAGTHGARWVGNCRAVSLLLVAHDCRRHRYDANRRRVVLPVHPCA